MAQQALLSLTVFFQKYVFFSSLMILVIDHCMYSKIYIGAEGCIDNIVGNVVNKMVP